MGLFTTTQHQPTLRGKARDAASAKKDQVKGKARDATRRATRRTNECCVCGRSAGVITKGGNRGHGEWALCGRPACSKKAANF